MQCEGKITFSPQSGGSERDIYCQKPAGHPGVHAHGGARWHNPRPSQIAGSGAQLTTLRRLFGNRR
jgi:hypothetical protein